MERLISGGAWMLAARLGSGMAGLVVYAILTRTISPAEMASYFLAVSMVSAANVVVSLGAKDAVVRCLAESISGNHTARARAFIRAGVQWGVFGAGLSALAYMAVAPWLSIQVLRDPRLATASGLIALWIACSGLQGLAADLFRGLQKYPLAACFQGTPGLLSGICFLLSLLAIRLAGHAESFRKIAALNVLSLLAALCLAAFWLRRQMRHLAAAPCADPSARRLLALSWPMLASNLLLYVISQADLWCVGHFLARQQVALYAAAWRLSQLVSLPLALTNAVLPPLIAELHAQGRRLQLESLLRSAATLGSIPALLCCLVMLAAGGHALALLYGRFYAAAAWPLAVLSAGSASNVLAGSSGFTLLMTGHARALLGITFSVGLLFLTGEWMAVPRFGAGGAAVVAASAMALQNLGMVFWVRKRLGIWTHVHFSRRAAPALNTWKPTTS